MQDPEQTKIHIDELKDALRRYPEPQIQGAKLNVLIQKEVPELNVRAVVDMPVGPGALKRFVAAYLSDILQHTGYNGGDVVYGIEGRVAEPALQQDSRTWKTFVSPGSTAVLVVKQDHSGLDTRRVAELQPDELTISKVTMSEHDDLRKRFVESLDADLAEKVKKISDGTEAYGEWLAAIRQQGSTLSKRWGEFRRDGLIEILRSRLSELPISDDAKSICIKQLTDSQFSSHVSRMQKTEISKPGLTYSHSAARIQKASEPLKGIDFARKLAHAVIDIMGYDELRAVHLPLGTVLDAMNEQQ